MCKTEIMAVVDLILMRALNAFKIVNIVVALPFFWINRG